MERHNPDASSSGFQTFFVRNPDTKLGHFIHSFFMYLKRSSIVASGFQLVGLIIVRKPDRSGLFEIRTSPDFGILLHKNVSCLHSLFSLFNLLITFSHWSLV